jgi:hypothetical protein
MIIRNPQTEYVTVQLPLDTAQKLGLLNQVEVKPTSQDEPIATFREMAALG